MLRADGSLVLINFVMAGGMTGDSAYQSPEQIADERVDHRSDLFSLGVVLHEMLTGQRPVRMALAQPGFAAEQVDDFPPLPRTHWRLQPLMDQLLAPRPQQRFGSAVELLQALRAELLRCRLPRGL